jgi:hypothetical protein
LNVLQNYLSELSSQFGKGWNRFWFRPVSPAPLGLVRLVTGFLALWWYLSFYPDLEFWYGPQGIIDSQTLDQWRGPNPVFSIFDWPQTSASLWFAYWLGLAVLLLFAAGLFSRITSVAALVVVVSLVLRGPMLARPMEDVLAMVMLYICFGPSGGAFSLDRLRQGRTTNGPVSVDPAPSLGANIALRLIQVHLALIHFAMAIGQLRDDSWWMGRAVWGFIGKPESGYIDVTWMSDYMYLLNFWTHGIVVFEFAFALLIWNRLARPILFVAAVVVWGSVGLVSGMLDFALVMLAATLAFVPPEWLERRKAA